MADFSVSEVSLVGTGATQTGRAVKMTNCDKVVLSFIVTIGSALTTGPSTLVLGGTNDDARAIDSSATLPTLTTSSAISALPANVTLTAGVLSFATTVATGTHEICIAYSAVPKFVRPVWTLGGGGGTMTTQVTIAGWSTST